MEYVYPKGFFPTNHIGHFTITCLMDKEDARRLYIELLSKIGNSNMINVKILLYLKRICKDDNIC